MGGWYTKHLLPNERKKTFISYLAARHRVDLRTTILLHRGSNILVEPPPPPPPPVYTGRRMDVFTYSTYGRHHLAGRGYISEGNCGGDWCVNLWPGRGCFRFNNSEMATLRINYTHQRTIKINHPTATSTRVIKTSQRQRPHLNIMPYPFWVERRSTRLLHVLTSCWKTRTH